MFRFLPIAVCLSLFVSTAHSQLPAFPGAEGFGAYASGGRGGDVYIVTNLNSSGPGSLAEGVATVPSSGRTIVFAVSGYIHINPLRVTKSKLTIAGQTAPGGGIGLKDGTFRISADDVVVRHLRIRHGKYGGGGDCVNLDSGSVNSVLDHISMQFSTDENMSSYNSPPENLTLQWSLNGWGLESHSAGGLWDQNHATCHHTLWAHNHTRNPKARPGGLLEWINNVTYDWDIGFIMGDSQTPADWKANVIGSYFLSPPGNTRSRALEKARLDRHGNPNFSLHLSDCRHDSDGNGLLDGTDKGYGIASGDYITLAVPADNTGSNPVTVDDPVVAFKKVVSKSGALRLDVNYGGALRDEVDTRMISNLVTQTRENITRESELGLSNDGFGTLESEAAPVDSDKDGMPDFYETALGWNVASQDHNTPVSGASFLPAGSPAGYTRLEEYLHFKSIPHGAVPKNISGAATSVDVDMARFTSGFSSSPVFAVSNVSGGSVSVAGSVATFAPTLNFAGRAGFDFTVTDSAGHSWTQHCALVVTNTGLPRNLRWRGSGSVWNQSAANWLRPSTGTVEVFSTGDRVSFDQSGAGQPSVDVTEAVSPSGVDVDAPGDYTFTGSGQINSTGVLTKRGTGTLTLRNFDTYTEGVSLEAGKIALDEGGRLGGGAVTMLEGTELVNAHSANDTAVLDAGIEVPSGSTALVRTGNRFRVQGPLSGDGTLEFDVQTGVSRFDMRGPAGGFGGTLRFLNDGGARLFFNGGSFDGFDNCTVDLEGPVSLQPQTNSGGNTLRIGALTGGASGGRLEGGTAGPARYVIGAKGGDTVFEGGIHGNATLTKTGGGKLTLAGTNTYTGDTVVEDGALIVNGSTGSGAITVEGGAQLRGTGTTGGDVTLESGAQVSPGAASGALGVLTAGAGFTGNDTTFSMQLSSSPAGVNDRLSITGGTGRINGTNQFNVYLEDGGIAAGSYKLIDCAPGVPLSVSGGMVMNLNLNAPPSTRQSFTLNRTASGTSGGYVRLLVSGNAADILWAGGLNGAAWDLNSTANFSGGATFYNFDAVTFDDSSTNRNVSLDGSLEPASVEVNTAQGYTFSGDGSIDGQAALVKNGSGALTFLNGGENGFYGGVELNAGEIVLGRDTANRSALGGGTVTMGNGTVISMNDNGSTYNDFNGDLHVPDGVTARLNADSRVDVHGELTGGGLLEFYVPWVRTTLFADWSDFSGTIRVLTDSSGGDFRIGNSYNPPGYANAGIDLASGVWFYFSGTSSSGEGTTIEIGEFAGAAGSHLRGGSTGGRALTYRIGGKTGIGEEVVFSGNISEQNSGTLTNYYKTGAGTWRLAGVDGYWAGGTRVEQGTLCLDGSDITCAGGTAVAGGARLKFAGGSSLSTDVLTVEPGAIVSATGDVAVSGDLNNKGTVTMENGMLSVSGDIFNEGTMRLGAGTLLQTEGAIVNSGVLDLLTSDTSLLSNLTNTGTVVLNSERRILDAWISGGNFVCTIHGYSGHTYRLQRSMSLDGGWANTGTAKAGNGSVLTFTDAAAGDARYYRIVIAP